MRLRQDNWKAIQSQLCSKDGTNSSPPCVDNIPITGHILSTSSDTWTIGTNHCFPQFLFKWIKILPTFKNSLWNEAIVSLSFVILPSFSLLTLWVLWQQGCKKINSALTHTKVTLRILSWALKIHQTDVQWKALIQKVEFLQGLRYYSRSL